MATYSAGSGGPPITEDITQEQDNSGFQTINLELRRLLDARENKLLLVNQTILDIHKKTERKVENQIAQKNEFYGNDGKLIKEGKPYHIHYTKDLNEYYMTGAKHSVTSKLINRVDLTKSDFGYYNNLNKQSPLIIKSAITIPTEEDYNNGFVTRYFAKKANETSSPAFEVSAEDFGSSPLYNFTSLKWYIRGNKSLVLKTNRRLVYIASFKIPNLSKLLPDFQYFRAEESLSPKELAIERLGTTQQTTTQQQTNTNSTAGGYSAGSAGPPPEYTGG